MILFAYKNELLTWTTWNFKMIFNKTSAVFTFGEQDHARVGKALWILDHPGLTEDGKGIITYEE